MQLPLLRQFHPAQRQLMSAFELKCLNLTHLNVPLPTIAGLLNHERIFIHQRWDEDVFQDAGAVVLVHLEHAWRWQYAIGVLKPLFRHT